MNFKLRLLIATAVTLFGLFLYTGLPVAAADAPADSAEASLLEIAELALLAQNDARILDGTKALPLSQSAVSADRYLPAVQQQVAQLEARSVALATLGESFTSYTTELTQQRITTEGEQTVLYAQEFSAFQRDVSTDAANMPALYEYRLDHRFAFTQDEGGWRLVSAETVNLPETYSDLDGEVEMTPTFDDPATNVEPLAGLFGRQEDSGKTQLYSTINRSNVQWYANTYWDNYNSAYRTFDGHGGDCTNFVSQAMRHGGWSDDLGWYRSTSNWWYNSSNQTWTWINVGYFFDFTNQSGRGSIAGHVSDLQIGDVLQVDFQSDGVKDHTMVVTAKSGSTIYLTYHSNDTHNKSIWDLTSSYPNATWWGWLMN